MISNNSSVQSTMYTTIATDHGDGGWWLLVAAGGCRWLMVSACVCKRLLASSKFAKLCYCLETVLLDCSL